MMKLLYIVPLIPVVVTIAAALVQGYFLWSRVLLPLRTFDETAQLQELVRVVRGQLGDSQFHSAPTFFQRHVYEKYLINIVQVVGGGGATSHQRKVLTSVRKHLAKTLHTLQIVPSLTFQVRQSTQIDEELNNIIQYAQVPHGDSTLQIPFLLQSDISKYAASSESVFHSTAGTMPSCEESRGCKELTFAYYVPDFSQQQQQEELQGSEQGSGFDIGALFAPFRVVSDADEMKIRASEAAISASNTPLDDAESVPVALLLPNKGCFAVLHLTNATHYDAVDANTIYTTTTNTIQCLRSLLSIPNVQNSDRGSMSADTTEDMNTNTAATSPHSVVAADPALNISPADISHYHHAHLLSMLHSTLHKLNTLVELHNYREDVLALISMSGHQRSAYREIFDILSQIRQLGRDSKAYSAVETFNASSSDECGCEGGSEGGSGSKNNMCKSTDTISSQHCTNTTTPRYTLPTLSKLLHRAYMLVTDLETDPEGGLQAPPPIEQYFAIFGPYWLPVMVPVYRAVKSMFLAV